MDAISEVADLFFGVGAWQLLFQLLLFLIRIGAPFQLQGPLLASVDLSHTASSESYGEVCAVDKI